MVQDLLTAIALLLIIEGLLPGISPTAWQKAMAELANISSKTIRVVGIASMLGGALLLQLVR
jgi:uncharacterized protein YjeT (DUF2065 family)